VKRSAFHFLLKLLRYLKLALPTRFPVNNLAYPFANAVGDIVDGDVERLAVLRDAAQGVRCCGD
jgi:hypothetical protein